MRLNRIGNIELAIDNENKKDNLQNTSITLSVGAMRTYRYNAESSKNIKCTRSV